MLRISKLADYAIVVTSGLAGQNDRYFSATCLAERSSLPVPTVSKILKMLSESAVVESRKGVMGGYRLLRPADEICLLDIIQSIDGKLALTECNKNTVNCVYLNSCKLQRSWQVVNRVIAKVFSQLTLADMIDLLEEEQGPLENRLYDLVKLPFEGYDCHE